MTAEEFVVPEQRGRTFVVTGANKGIGYHITEQLAATGARVVLACRDLDSADAAASVILRRVPEADLRIVHLDLADLESIHAAAAEITIERVDVLVNNAGLTDVKARWETWDGFELVFGTNHLGPFALTGLLMPALLSRPGARVVSTASIAARWGKLNFEDLHSQLAYDPSKAYSASKLANLLFAMELDRRLRSAHADVMSLAAHPGFALDAHTPARPPIHTPATEDARWNFATRVMTQGKHDGAQAAVRAATDDDAVGGQYYGPSGWQELKGPPALIKLPKRAQDIEARSRLWEVSQELTGVEMPL